MNGRSQDITPDQLLKELGQYDPGTPHDLSESLEDLIRQISPHEEPEFQQPVNNAALPAQGWNFPSNNVNQYSDNPHDDVLVRACYSAGIPPMSAAASSEHSASSILEATQYPHIVEGIEFETKVDSVQFRYQKEIDRKTTSPIHDIHGGKVRIKIWDLNPTEKYRVTVSLVDRYGNASIHSLYKTKGQPQAIPIVEESIPSLLSSHVFPIDSVGVLRHANIKGEEVATRKKTEKKDSQDSVWLLASLYRVSDNMLICQAKSDEIYDIKKLNLKIHHINPGTASESGRQEMTILCSKIKESTKVKFSIGEWVEEVTPFRMHHGVALVLLVPQCPSCLINENYVEAQITLYCPQTKKSSQPITFTYKADPLRSFQSRTRDRSPLRDQLETDSSVLEEDPLVNEMKDLSIRATATVKRERPSSAVASSLNYHSSKSSPMSDLTLIRDVACGNQPWSNNVATVIKRSPYILQVPDKEGLTPPMEALVRGKEELFTQLLDAVDEEFQRQVVSMRTPCGASFLQLMAVAENASDRTLNRLLSLDVDPQNTDHSGQTVLHWLVEFKRHALLQSSIKAIRLFFRKKDPRSVSSEMSSLLNRTDNDGRSALHAAVLCHNVEAINTLVIENSVDVNIQSRNGFTALHWAVVVNDEVAVQRLLKFGARVRAKTKWGATVLKLAEENSSVSQKIVDLLNEAISRRSSCESESG